MSGEARGVVGDGSPTAMSVEEAAQRLIGAILVEFGDRDDDYLMPMRSTFEQIAEACNAGDADLSPIPEWESVGWLRARSRAALERLAAGEQIPRG